VSIDDFKSEADRKVWQNKNGSNVMSVKGFLTKGEYKVKEKESHKGTLLLFKDISDE